MSFVRPSIAALGSLMVVLAVGASAGCDQVFGLSDLHAADAGVTADGARDAGEAGLADTAEDVAPPPGGAIFVASASTASDWCAVTSSGEVKCWGNNESGELGNGTTKPSAMPVTVMGLPLASSVAIGVGTTCAITQDGAAYCWGLGLSGQLGNGKAASSTKPVQVNGLTSGVTSISSATDVVCAVQRGAALCWGLEGVGLLGPDQTGAVLVPTPVPGLTSGVTSISVGNDTACAVKHGAVYCWGGFSAVGELGNGTLRGSFTPVLVPTLASGVAEVSVGGSFVCARTIAGAALCWGNGSLGTLGNGQLAVNPAPVQVEGLTGGVLALSAGQVSVTAILTGGRVVAWGYAGDGELGNGAAEADSGLGNQMGVGSPVPVHVEGLSGPAVSISTGTAPCAATKAGAVECWGVTAEDALSPVPVTLLVGSRVTSITAGGNLSTGQFACAVTPDVMPSLFCWGGNGAGQLGNGNHVEATTPAEVPLLTSGPTLASAGVDGDFACGIASSLAYCWGDNGSGQLGNGTAVSSDQGVAVAGLTGAVTSIAAGASSACAVVTPSGDAGPDAGEGGVLYCWGDNTYGQLGTGSNTSSSVPVQITALGSHVVSVSVGVDFACAVLGDGTADCWGTNASGQLGNGTTKPSSSPTPVEGLAGVTAIAAGWYSACAVVGGGVECWGDNSYGELGNGSGTLDSSSVPVPTLSSTGFLLADATQVALGPTSGCAVVSRGVVCWGAGTLGNDSSPGVDMTASVPVNGLGPGSGVMAVAVGNEFACAAAASGAYCWGYNTAGELGNGGAVDAFLPQPIAGFP